MKKLYQDFFHAKKELSISDYNLNRAIKKMKLRHPFENWIFIREAPNGQTTIYFDTEFVDWVKEVYLSKEGYYLDLEIKFYENLIHKYEKELGNKYLEIQYTDMTIKDMMAFFNKDTDSVRVAIYKMCREFNPELKVYANGDIIIKAEGVKWIHEKYYRKTYLSYLENLKHSLEGMDIE